MSISVLDLFQSLERQFLPALAPFKTHILEDLKQRTAILSGLHGSFTFKGVDIALNTF